MLYQPTSKEYPQQDERFAALPDEMTLGSCSLWTTNFPPSPEFCPGEDYKDFVKRQTFYATYRNDVVARRDELKLQQQKLNVPKAPVGEDISAAIDWIQATGVTPLEFLTKTYRDTGQLMGHRLSAASKLMEYVHRKMPAQVEVDNKGEVITAKQFDPVAIASLSEKELGVLERLLDKMVVKG